MECDLPGRLNWARLRQHADGSAEVLDCDGTVTHFPTVEDARLWLLEDEFTVYDDELRSDYPDIPWASVSVPTAADDAGLVGQTLVELPRRDAHAELRVYGEPEWNLGFEVITRHPLADDQPTLARLGMAADECTNCDLYWVVNETLVFVGIASAASPGGQQGVSVRRHTRGPTRLSFNLVTERAPLTSSIVGDALRWLQSWIDAMALRGDMGLPESWTTIAKHDVIAPAEARPRYQLVLQRPGVNFDDLVALEENVRATLGREHFVDGHDFGSGEGNVFVLTNSPWAAFNRLVAGALVTVVPGMKVAFRERAGNNYTILWPPEATIFGVR